MGLASFSLTENGVDLRPLTEGKTTYRLPQSINKVNFQLSVQQGGQLTGG